jgi:hypothetical protein
MHNMAADTLDQYESPFFLLLRELRDEVYHYYVEEKNGYEHNAKTGTLRAVPNNAVDISLSYTCKRIAEEMYGLAFKTNAISFRTLRDAPDTDYRPSKAALYEQLLDDRALRLERMLFWSRCLLSPKTLQKLRSQYPDSLAV